MNIINDYIRIEEKSVFSHKVYNIVGISAEIGRASCRERV